MLSQINKVSDAKWKDLGGEYWKINFMIELINDIHKITHCGPGIEEASNIL